jgi:hypothetical protein
MIGLGFAQASRHDFLPINLILPRDKQRHAFSALEIPIGIGKKQNSEAKPDRYHMKKKTTPVDTNCSKLFSP